MGKTYNRIAKDQHAVGHAFMGRGVAPLLKEHPHVEAFLELHRPPHCMARKDTTYMREDRDFSMMGLQDWYTEGYVHQVEPKGPVEKRDVRWIGALQALMARSEMASKYYAARRKTMFEGLSNEEIAEAYWTGRESREPSWEFVTIEGEVIAVDDKPSPLKS